MTLKERNQNYWQLACITGTALGLPAMVIGGQLGKLYGPGTALIAVLIGNFVLWIMGLGIISMAQHKKHAIENVKEYLGNISGIFAALIWVCSFLIWYILQVKGVAIAVGGLFQNQNIWKIGGVLGLLVTALGIGGIRLIRWVCVVGMPLLICFAIYAIAISGDITQFKGTWAFSFSAILPIVLIWLPFGVNLPTFFRYSRSKPDSILGLSLMTIFHIFFQSFTILVGLDDPAEVISKYDATNTLISGIATVGFILITYVCVNLLNIYFASVSWETIIPQHRSTKEYLIIGLVGTATYIFLQTHPLSQFLYSMEFLEGMLVSFIASLATILLLGFLTRMVVRHRTRAFEKLWSSVCWAIGCIASVVLQTQSRFSLNDSVIVSMVTSLVAFLIIVFIEESIWSINHLIKTKK